jgi:SAM-dependent methyltransferase
MRRLDYCRAHFGLADISVLDVGCGPGHYLKEFGPGSVGLDIYPGQALEGVEIRRWVAGDGIPDDLHGQFDAVWCSNLLEHVRSPHELLLEMRPAFKPHGQVFVLAPRTNKILRGPWRGFTAGDHISFFSPLTLLWTVRRAGFDVEWVGSPSVPPWTPLWLAARLGHIGPVLAAVGRRIEDFQYPQKAIKKIVDGRMVYMTDDEAGDWAHGGADRAGSSR